MIVFLFILLGPKQCDAQIPFIIYYYFFLNMAIFSDAAFNIVFMMIEPHLHCGSMRLLIKMLIQQDDGNNASIC